MRTTSALLLFAAVALATPAAASQMSGPEIKSRITGKRVFLAVPFGGEFPLLYRRDGKVEGSGEAIGLGRWFQPKDEGRWWVEGDRLCQQWRTWYEGRPQCFTLQATGENTLSWVQQDGTKGTARVAD